MKTVKIGTEDEEKFLIQFKRFGITRLKIASFAKALLLLSCYSRAMQTKKLNGFFKGFFFLNIRL